MSLSVASKEDAANLRCSHPASLFTCLKERIAKYQVLSPKCYDVIAKRRQEQALHLDFDPILATTCASERADFCGSVHIQGAAVVDCLADGAAVVDCLADARRHPDFGADCRQGLTERMANAVSDIRLLSSLRNDCSDDIHSLCDAIEPGKGRLLACLQKKRGHISSPECRRQIIRLLGFVVEDYRIDFDLMQSCKADTQKFCHGADTGGGAMHACLRKSRDHLSPACREAEDQVELLEHEDVRLNPKIMRECPLAISTFCSDVQHGGTGVLMCLREAMNQPHFPPPCKAVLLKHIEHSRLKYSLNPRLKDACDSDILALCPEAVDADELQSKTKLYCLSDHASALSDMCRAEVAAVLRVHLYKYGVGLPLTSPCDDDVRQWCKVDHTTAPHLEAGSVQACLIRHLGDLQGSCWTLLSMFDDGQYQKAVHLEEDHWNETQIQEVTKHMVAQVQYKILDQMRTNLTQLMSQHISALNGPHFDTLVQITRALGVMMVMIMGCLAWLFTRSRRRSHHTVIMKDGRA
eukprot:gene3542-13611_t